jgi:hypothetical protein
LPVFPRTPGLKGQPGGFPPRASDRHRTRQLSSPPAQARPPSGYTPVFDEEFNGPLDVAPGTGWGDAATHYKWTCHTPYASDFGDAWFSSPNDGPTETPPAANPFSVQDGYPKARARAGSIRAWQAGRPRSPPRVSSCRSRRPAHAREVSKTLETFVNQNSGSFSQSLQGCRALVEILPIRVITYDRRSRS